MTDNEHAASRLRLSDIPDCEGTKRALEVALAGEHGLLLLHTRDVPGPELASVACAMAGDAGLVVRAAAFSLCPCGAYGSLLHDCICPVSKIVRHQRTIAACAAEWDMAVEVAPPWSGKTPCGESEETVMERIRRGRTNELDDNILDGDCEAMLQMYVDRYGSDRVSQVKRVARTIARLDGTRQVQIQHIVEAVQYQIPLTLLVPAAKLQAVA